MTETKPDAAAAPAPAPAPLEPEVLAAKVLRQVEYYFGDESFPFDDYLKSKVDGEGYVALGVVCAFAKMKAYGADEAAVAAALAGSDALALDAARARVKRAFPTPDADPDRARTVYVSGCLVSPDKNAMEAAIKQQMGKFGAVERVRCLRNLSQDGRQLDGSAFVVFEAAEDVATAVECSGSVMGGRKINIQAAPDWFARLGKKRDAMKRKKDQKEKDAAAGVVRNAQNEPKPVVLGCVLRLEGLGDVPEASREDLKALVEGAGAAVSYVEFERGQAAGHVRLDKPEAAAAAAKLGEAKIRDVGVTVTVLAGDDEQQYWARLAESAKNARKRQHGGRNRGGRGGGKRRKW